MELAAVWHIFGHIFLKWNYGSIYFWPYFGGVGQIPEALETLRPQLGQDNLDWFFRAFNATRIYEVGAGTLGQAQMGISWSIYNIVGIRIYIYIL